jgi:hypothetical protein
MATLTDIQFEQHPCGEGFEGQISFENNWAMMVVCGPAVYHREGADLEAKASAGEYTTFEYFIIQHMDGAPEPIEENWVGPVSAAQLNTVIAEVEGRAFYEPYVG